MQEVTIKLTTEALNVILQALADSVNYRQQNTTMLISSLQGQANSQVQPVSSSVPQA